MEIFVTLLGRFFSLDLQSGVMAQLRVKYFDRKTLNVTKSSLTSNRCQKFSDDLVLCEKRAVSTTA